MRSFLAILLTTCIATQGFAGDSPMLSPSIAKNLFVKQMTPNEARETLDFLRALKSAGISVEEFVADSKPLPSTDLSLEKITKIRDEVRSALSPIVKAPTAKELKQMVDVKSEATQFMVDRGKESAGIVRSFINTFRSIDDIKFPETAKTLPKEVASFIRVQGSRLPPALKDEFLNAVKSVKDMKDIRLIKEMMNFSHQTSRFTPDAVDHVLENLASIKTQAYTTSRSNNRFLALAGLAALGVIAGLYYLNEHFTEEGAISLEERERLESQQRADRINRRMIGSANKFNNSDVAKLAKVLLNQEDYSYFVQSFFNSNLTTEKIFQNLKARIDKYPLKESCKIDAYTVLPLLMEWDADLIHDRNPPFPTNKIAKYDYERLAKQDFKIEGCGDLARNRSSIENLVADNGPHKTQIEGVR